MKINEEEIKHIADLSMLELTNAEIEKYTKSMSDIVEFANKISEVNTEEISASTYVSNKENVFRKDEIEESLDRALVMQNAPTSNGEAYSIPNMAE